MDNTQQYVSAVQNLSSITDPKSLVIKFITNMFSDNRDKTKSIFNYVDSPRPADKYGRMAISIFAVFHDPSKGITDKAAQMAGATGFNLKQFTEEFDNFNCDTLFTLFAYMIYWFGGDWYKKIVFDGIINPMFNLGLKTVNVSRNAFTNPEARFFMPYYDYLLLQKIATGPDTTNMITFYTNHRQDSHTVDAKPYAIQLLSLLQNYPFTSGYFVDGLSNPDQIINREM